MRYEFLSVFLLTFVLLFSIYLYYRYKNTQYLRKDIKEHLSLTYAIPKDLPDIKLNETYFEDHLYSLIHKKDNKQERNIQIIYTKADDIISKKFVIFENLNFKENNQQSIYLLFESSLEQSLFIKIKDVISIHSSIFRNVPLVEIDVNHDSSIIDSYMNSGKRVLYPCFINNDDGDKIKLLNNLKILIFDYMKWINDYEKIKFYFPLASIQTLHMINIFPEKKELQYIYKFLAYPMVIYTNKIELKNESNKKAFSLLQKYFSKLSVDVEQDFALLNLLQKHGFNVIYQSHIHSERFIEKFEETVPIVLTLSVKQQVELDVLQFYKPLPFKKFQFYGDYVDKTQLRKGDKLLLTNQENNFENGHYFVSFISKRERFQPSKKVKVHIQNGILVNWLDKFIDILKIDQRQNELVVRISRDHPDLSEMFDMLYELLPIFIEKPYLFSGLITHVERSHILVNLKDLDKNDSIERLYECYNYSRIKTREACEDPNSFELQMEQLKHLQNEKESSQPFAMKIGTWDRRCLFDSECPFFEKNGKGYRGGCHNGYCEMPVNIQRRSFRRYFEDETSFPLCQGCDSYTTFEDMNKCCEKRKKRQKGQNVYVFSKYI